MFKLYRIRKCSKGDRIWFTAERRILPFMWGNCIYGRAKFDTIESAKAAVESHKRLTARVKKELVIKL